MSRPNYEIVTADSREYLRGMGDASVDVTITDPPFGAVTHAGARGKTPTGVRDLVDFDSITADDFLAFCAESVRVTRRWVVMTCEWRHAAMAEAAGLPVVRLGVWVKPDAAPQFTGDRPATGWEAVLILHRPGRKRWNGGGHHAVWTYRVERGAHRTQKPVPLLRKWVRQFSDPGELILDPYAGSGTTGVASLAEGRRCLLIERDPKWTGVIAKRLARPHAAAARPTDAKNGRPCFFDRGAK